MDGWDLELPEYKASLLQAAVCFNYLIAFLKIIKWLIFPDPVTYYSYAFLNTMTVYSFASNLLKFIWTFSIKCPEK